MDATTFAQYVAIAGGCAIVAGPIGAAVTQLIKLLWGLVTRGGSPSSNAQAGLGALLGAAIAAVMTWQAGVPWPYAVGATLVALFTPKSSYDAAKALQVLGTNGKDN